MRCTLLMLSAVLSIALPVLANELSFSSIEGSGGVPLNVIEAGKADGPAILMIHGLGMGALSFRPQLESDLAKDFRIVALDLRGHGNSGKPWRGQDLQPSEVWADDVAAVIKVKNLKRSVIVGWSYGGFVAADYIRKYGVSDIAGLNLVGSFAGLVKQSRSVGSLTPEEMKHRTTMQTSGNLADNVLVMNATINIFEFPGMTLAYREEMRLLGLMLPGYVRKLLEKRQMDHQDVTPMLTLPVLITMGSNDVAKSADAYARLKTALPKAQYSVFDGMGHLPFAQDPKRFNEELAMFVKAANN